MTLAELEGWVQKNGAQSQSVIFCFHYLNKCTNEESFLIVSKTGYFFLDINPSQNKMFYHNF